MKHSGHGDLGHLSMFELFRVEAENQIAALTAGLLEWDRSVATPQLLESLMRAAHSLKGAARLANLHCAVRVAHAMEDYFVAAQRGNLPLQWGQIDALLCGVDLLQQIAKCEESELKNWEVGHERDLDAFVATTQSLIQGKPSELHSVTPSRTSANQLDATELTHSATPSSLSALQEHSSRVVRLNADTLNRLLGLAGESLVETRWLQPFAESMQRLKRMHTDLAATLENLRQLIPADKSGEAAGSRLAEAADRAKVTQDFLSSRLAELEHYERRTAHLSNQLYLEVLRTRMRPFGEGVQAFPRMVRDLANSLGKQVALEIVGENAQVDRDILEQLETPLMHLLRNAVDHGCELPANRRAVGKPSEALIVLEARHNAGMLLVTVTDDGAGVDLEKLREVIVSRQLSTPAAADKLDEAELLEFLFLPGFSLKDRVTELSGRGVGLDVVHNAVKEMRGTVRVATRAGQGIKFQLQLPLTLSVLRTLLVEVAGEPYALPLAEITHTLKLPRARVETLEGRFHFALGDQHVALLNATEVWGGQPTQEREVEWPVVVLGERHNSYGLIVDRLLGERELLVQPLDPRLGKIQDINAAALMEDGSPVLIVDVDELLHTIDNLVASGDLARPESVRQRIPTHQKRILAVDDSLSVRELERRLLTCRGYVVDVAADGVDAWNALRTTSYDLVITDVDMPRMDGIELVTLIKSNAQSKTLPVILVSYKDREVDRLHGLSVGGDYYLPKGSFHDETLLQAVQDLIGSPQ